MKHLLFKKVNKKGQVFSQLTGLGIGIAALCIILAIMFLVMSQVRTQVAEVQGITNVSAGAAGWTEAYNATGTLIQAGADVPPWIPLIVIVVVGGLLIFLVSGFGRGRR